MGNVEGLQSRDDRQHRGVGGWEKQEEPPMPSAVVVVVLAETNGGV